MKRLVVTLTLVLTLLAQIVPVASLPAAAAGIEWTASITGSITVAGDTYTDTFTAAVAEDASSSAEYDVYDIENPPPPSEGSFDLYSRLGSIRFMWDVRLPTPPIVWTIKVATDMEGSATLTWDVSEVPASYTLSLKDEGTGTPIDPRTSGSYTFSISAETRTFTLAASAAAVNLPPTVTSLYPQGGEIVSGTPNVQAQATDADGTVQSVEFEYSPDWGDTWLSIGTDTDGSDGWSIPWNTTSVADGTYYLIQATGIDNLGATGSGQSDEVFTVDNTAPAAPLLVSPLATDTDETPAFAWSEVTDPAGVAYTLWIDDNWDLIPLIDKTELTATQYELATAEALGAGTYNWAVKAVDGAGNESPWSDIGQFTVVDTTAPAAPALALPGPGAPIADSTPVFGWSEVTDPSGVSYSLEIGNSDFSSLSLSQTGLTAPQDELASGEALADGTYYWRVQAVDGAGNESPWSATRSFLVDTTAPAVTLTPLAQEVIQDNILTFSGSAADAATAVDSVEYRLNSGNWIAAQAVDGAFDELSEDYTFTTTALTEGPYAVEVRAADALGNTTTLPNYAREVFVIIPSQVSAGSVVTLSVSNQVPPPLNAIAEADTELVFSSDTGAVTGVVMVAKYSQEPPLTTSFSVGTDNTPLKFIDVKATFATATSPGKVTLKIHYTDAEVTAAGLDEGKLKIFYWDGDSWEEAANSSVDKDNNVVSGDVPVSALSGTPIGLGGSAPIAIPPLVWVLGGGLLLLMIVVYLFTRRRRSE